MEMINRDVIIVMPKKPLFDWENSIYPDHPAKMSEDPLAHDAAHVYLIPEMESPEDFEIWIKENYEPFFEEELFAWCTDESLWPEKLTYKMFTEWFTVSYQSMVLDSISDGPLEHDEY